MRAIGVRTLDHGPSGTTRPSRSATPAAISAPCGPYDDPSPTGPPSCTGQLGRQRAQCAGRLDRGRRRQRPVTLANVVGRANWPSVRPIIGAVPCAAESASTSGAASSRRSAVSVAARVATTIAAVSRMSWLVAPRWTNWAASSADGGAQLLDEADHRDAAAFGRRAEGVDVELVDPARRGDRRRGVGRDLAGRGLGGGERRFDVELRLQPRRRRRRFGDRAAGDEDGRTDRRQIARKTDSSPSPWSRMSKRYCRGTVRRRRRGGGDDRRRRRASVGSVSLAAASSGK